MHKCPVHGCHKKLDENGYPVKYCDFQQGRCPMQKETFSSGGLLFLGSIFIIMGLIIWSTI